MVLPEYRKTQRMEQDYRIIICTGPRCAPPGEAQALYDHLQMLTTTLEQENPSLHITCRTTHCTGICRDGPVMVVHPDKVWYCRLDTQKIARIVQEHFQHGQPVAEYTFERNP